MSKKAHSFAERVDPEQMIAFDDTLSALQIQGSVLLNEVYAPPWAIRIPPGAELRAHLRAAADTRTIPFHLVRHGGFTLRLDSGAHEAVHAGEVAVVFGGAGHVMYEQSPFAPVEFADILKGGYAQVRAPRAGDSELICGVFLLKNATRNPLFDALPPLLRADVTGRFGGSTLRMLSELLAREVGADLPGRAFMSARVLEMLCAEAIRAHMALNGCDAPGWFAGLRDPKVGAALNRIHADPGAPLSVPRLAAEVGMSGSRFAARFREKTGVSPMRYVSNWRMNLAARLLAESSQSIAQIAGQVGYDSLPAFARAFRKEFDCPPGKWRDRAAELSSAA